MIPMEQEKHPPTGDRISDIMIGLPDGLTIPFVLAAGMSGLNANSITIASVGLAVSLTGAVAMGLGRYFSGRPNDTPHRIQDLGLSPETADAITQDHYREKSKWDTFVAQFELDIRKPDPAQLRKSVFRTSLAYMLGGLVPILPFFFTGQNIQGLQWSAALTLLCLFISGYFKGYAAGLKPWQEAFRITLTGALAATAAFFAAKLLFQG